MNSVIIYQHSRYVEAALQHAFLAELIRFLWVKYPGEELQVYNAEVDSHGFDLVLTFRGVVRHVQLKSTMSTSKTNRFAVNKKLANAPGGCVLLMIYDASDLVIRDYQFYGYSGAQQFPGLTSMPQVKRRGKIRVNTSAVRRGLFHERMPMGMIVNLLFGNQGQSGLS